MNKSKSEELIKKAYFTEAFILMFLAGIIIPSFYVILILINQP